MTASSSLLLEVGDNAGAGAGELLGLRDGALPDPMPMVDRAHDSEFGAKAVFVGKHSSEQFVQFVDVSKSYDGSRNVVDSLNLNVRRGEFLTMLGPSGSGKTTCLMMLAGFEAVTSGDVLIDGRSIRNVPPHRRNIGMVFQDYALFPHMTVAENLAFPLEARGLRKSDVVSKIQRALQVVQLSGLENRYPSQLSGGQQQRVAVARAVVYEPALILMDEPLGALDKQLREQMQLELKRIHANLGVTFVYVTHDQTEALTISDRIAIFNGGHVIQLATPSDLYEKPETAFVADFLGENNRLSGTVIESTGLSCRVRMENGNLLHSTMAKKLANGTQVWVCVRPETVCIDLPNSEQKNNFDAEVLEKIYLGDHIRIRLKTCGREDFLVKIQRNAEAKIPNPKEKCSVSWGSDSCRALTD
jgi:putative spermidine/putrescine transport system ATP-binding protein